jgi:hypothetical protein
MNAKKWIIMIGIVLLLAATVLLVFRQERQQYIILIPQGYTGQVQILFDQPGAAPLTYENRKAVIPISPTGHAATSDANRSGTIQYYFVDASGQRAEILNTPETIQNLHTKSGNDSGQSLPETIEFEVGVQDSAPTE